MTLRICDEFQFIVLLIPNDRFFHSFDLSLFLKTQYPTRSSDSPLTPIVSPAYASGRPLQLGTCASAPPTDPRNLSPSGHSKFSKGFTSPTLSTPAPNNCPLPVCLPSSPLSAPQRPLHPSSAPPASTLSLTYPGPRSRRVPQFRLCVPDALGSEKRKGAPPPPPPPLLGLQPSRSSPALPEPDAARPHRPFLRFPPRPGGGLGIRSRGWGLSASRSTPTSPRLELSARPAVRSRRVRAVRQRTGASSAPARPTRRARGRCSQPARE